MSDADRIAIRSSIPITLVNGTKDTMDIKTLTGDLVHVRCKAFDFTVRADDLLRAVKAVTTK